MKKINPDTWLCLGIIFIMLTVVFSFLRNPFWMLLIPYFGVSMFSFHRFLNYDNIIYKTKFNMEYFKKYKFWILSSFLYPFIVSFFYINFMSHSSQLSFIIGVSVGITLMLIVFRIFPEIIIKKN